MTNHLHEFRVYQAWPEHSVRDALDVFKREMYDGAGVPELQAGVRCLDFMTAKSQLSEGLAVDIDATVTQANMRISLLQAKPGHPSSSQDALQVAQSGVAQLSQLVTGVRRRFLEGRVGYSGDPDAIYAAVQSRVAARKEN